MIRYYLEKGSEVKVSNQSGDSFTYLIKGIMDRGDLGAGCLCYQANRIEPRDLPKTVLLKEFYPVDAGGQEIIREKDGKLRFPQNEELQARKDNFKKGIVCMEELVSDSRTREYICADEGIEVLYGNGTIYCENRFVTRFFSWLEAGNDKEVKMDELLQVAIGTIRFLRQLHAKGLAYMDLKPDDVLVPEREMGQMDFEKPLFYDFNSILNLNKRYRIRDIQIRTTEKYKADDFTGDLDEECEVNLRTENMTYGKVLEKLVCQKSQMVSEDVMEKLRFLIEHLKHPESDAVPETEVEERLGNIKEQIRDEEYEKEYRELPGKIRKYQFLRWMVMLITIMGYSGMAVVMSYMYLHTDRVEQMISGTCIRSSAAIALVLTASTLVLTALKILNWRVSERIANTKVSINYYHSAIRTGEYNTFRHGFRRKTTFQDKSESNQRRQRRRRILWVILFLGLVMGLVLSVAMKSFPVFLAWGFAVLLWFTYADFLPAQADFYRSFLLSEKNLKNKQVSVREGKALFYRKEYLEAEHSFDRSKDFYTKNNRDLRRMRKNVCRACFEDERRESAGLFLRLRAFFHHELRWKLVKEGMKKVPDLKYASLQIRHIYKMAFDRLRNRQLVVIIVVTLITLLAIVLDFIAFTDTWKDYIGLPEAVYRWLTLFCILGASITSIYQVAHSLQAEMLVSELSYKSRYVIDTALNEELVKDIAARCILPVDIARGTWQYEGYINTAAKQRERRRLRMSEPVFNRPLFHHMEYTNRSRLALTVWMTFGILLALLWQAGMFWIVPVLLTFTVLFHLVFRNFVLPEWGKQRLMRDIEAVLKEKMD